MYDTVNLRLSKEDVGSVSLLSTVPRYLTNVSEHSYHLNDAVVFTGYLDSLKVTVSEHNVKIKDSSISKWYLKDAFSIMTRYNVKDAFTKIADLLLLPIDKANVYRMDIAGNIDVKYDTSVYLNSLGQLSRFQRLEQGISGLYYSTDKMRLVFYDKIKEQRANREPIPDKYINSNILRYEQRYFHRPDKQLNMSKIRVSHLYDEHFFNVAIDGWLKKYEAIVKIRNLNPDLIDFKRNSSFKTAVSTAFTYYINNLYGGQNEFLKNLKDAQKMGYINKRQAYAWRSEIEKLYTVQPVVANSTDDDVVIEMDCKIRQLAEYYRSVA